jgi:hypothetical protein
MVSSTLLSAIGITVWTAVCGAASDFAPARLQLRARQGACHRNFGAR